MADQKTSIEAVNDLLPQLPEPQQREVQDFAEFLLHKTALERKRLEKHKRGGLGFAKGKIRIAEDFKDIPEGFENYLPE